MLVVVGGCGEQNRIASDFTPAADRIATAADDSGASIAPVVPAPAGATDSTPLPPARASVPGLELASSFTSFPGSDLAGTARVRPAGMGTRVDVALTGGASQRSYAGTLRLGSCDRPGPALHSLVEVSADSSGTGRAVSSLPIGLDSLARLSSVLVYGTGGRPEACASLGTGAPAAP